jgi:hypothetical protein
VDAETQLKSIRDLMTGPFDLDDQWFQSQAGVFKLIEVIAKAEPITGVRIENNILYFSFAGRDDYIRIADSLKLCCESRYMITDDDLGELIGQYIVNIDLGRGDDAFEDDCFNVLDSVFLKIQGSSSSVTIKNYNSHNGYYGGFNIEIF